MAYPRGKRLVADLNRSTASRIKARRDPGLSEHGATVADEFWLYRWLDEYEITSCEQAKSLLRPRSRAVRRLHELAAADPWRQLPPYQGGGAALVAGRGIDLSGDLGLLSQRLPTETGGRPIWTCTPLFR